MDIFWFIIIFLLILWVLGFGVFYIAGPFIHVILVVVVIMAVYRLITGRKV